MNTITISQKQKNKHLSFHHTLIGAIANVLYRLSTKKGRFFLFSTFSSAYTGILLCKVEFTRSTNHF